jgi:succinate dehydrogenase/fumarate reductase cytochrome b subunit
MNPREIAMESGGIFGILVLLADVWAILNIFQSRSGTGKKALWIVLVLVLPLLGIIIWYFAGPREHAG